MDRLTKFSIFFLLAALILAGCALPGLGARSIPQAAASGNAALPPINAPQATYAGPTGAPRLTPASAPASEPQRQPTTFSIPSLQTAPAGILARVSFLQTGGGSGYNGSDCESKPGEPRWCKPLNGASLPLTGEYRGIACGLSGQPVQAWLVLPDGSTRPLRVEGEAPFCREISRAADPNTLPGRYQVRVEQAGVSLVDSFQWLQPDRPQGTRLENCAWAAGLAPGQLVRLRVLGLSLPEASGDPLLGNWRYLAELSLSAGPDGQLWTCPSPQVQKDYPELAYLAMLPSGNLALGEEELLQAFQGHCFDSPPTRLAASARLRVLGKALPLFTDPTLDGRPLGSLESGSKGSVLGGPVCPPEGPWTWKVAFENGLVGWLAESDTASYFVEPTP